MNPIVEILEKVQHSQRILRHLDGNIKNKVLSELKNQIIARKKEILSANDKDLKALSDQHSSAFRDRLTLNEKRIDQILQSISDVINFNNPIGEVVENKKLENGLTLKKTRAPIGVLMIIFESRPNVVIDSFILSFKSGNSCILKGGKESKNTSKLFYECIEKSLSANGIAPFCCFGLTDYDRSTVSEYLKQNKYIDVVIPRGGESLIEFITQNTTIPIIKNDRGMCHAYVDEFANMRMAFDIIVNAKTQRPGVCNAIETVLVHSAVADKFIPEMFNQLNSNQNVEIFGCKESVQIDKRMSPALDQSFDTEYLDFKLNCKVVHSIEEAIEHIEKHGSHHSETIITDSDKNAKRFQNEIDAAVVYWNASTRFTDGYEFGLGGEIGISTQKLHARGPVGVKELTSLRWIVDGNGQIRK